MVAVKEVMKLRLVDIYHEEKNLSQTLCNADENARKEVELRLILREWWECERVFELFPDTKRHEPGHCDRLGDFG
jgi:hypothetical protein